ncbi:thermonuclease family protein, partial [Methyloceanibacter marginalis]|uniref:thermonuclease family protein n=1 Tax=Methyloceanibacter marginalis TaxID=1774971 RepID=UPI001874CC0B
STGFRADLVAQGFARVYSLADGRACIQALLVAEGEAREARRGLWRSWAYRVQEAGDASAWAGSSAPTNSSRALFTPSGKGANCSM